MRFSWFAALLALLTLQGCQQPVYITPMGMFAWPASDEGVLVVGVKLVNPPRSAVIPVPAPMFMGFVHYDEPTERRADDITLAARLTCEYALEVLNCGAGVTRYLKFAAPDGAFALGWVAQRDQAWRYADFPGPVGAAFQGSSLVGFYFRGQGPVHENAPRFQVGRGEAVYVGDLVLTFAEDGQLTISQELTTEAARESVGGSRGAAMKVMPFSIPAASPQAPAAIP